MSMAQILLDRAAIVDLTQPPTKGGSGRSSNTIPTFVMEHQQQDNWCWSAVSVSVDRSYDAGSAWTQCELVNQELSQTTCCNDGATTACDQPWFLDRALRRTGHLRHLGNGVLTKQDVRDEIDAGAPVGVRIAWSGGGGHFVVIAGYSEADGVLQVDVRDPWFAGGMVPYEEFLSSYETTGAWSHHYLTEG